jgi:hypothetical protein
VPDPWCTFLAVDGVTYWIYDNQALGKISPVEVGGLPAGLSARMSPAAARAHLRRKGWDAVIDTVEGRTRVAVRVCGGGAGLLMIWFDRRGRMRTIEHNVEI